jgi:dienelactone hydrolase
MEGGADFSLAERGEAIYSGTTGWRVTVKNGAKTISFARFFPPPKSREPTPMRTRSDCRHVYRVSVVDHETRLHDCVAGEFAFRVLVALAAVGTLIATTGPLNAQTQAVAQSSASAGAPLAGTKPLTLEGDIASQLVDGVDRFLLREIDQSVARRATHWKRDLSSADAYTKSIAPNRERLAYIAGVRESRVPFDAPELIGTTAKPALVGAGVNYDIFAVRWPAFADVTGEGLLLVPRKAAVADIVAIPDADQTPEQLCGLAPGIPPAAQFARRLAESGCRVVVPVLISRSMKPRAPPGRQGGANLTNREYIYRSAFELGRHLIGYELQKVMAVVDWFEKESGGDKARIGVAGYGEGGLLALYAGALDPRIDAVLSSGYFGPRENNWEQPLDRNVFGLLEQFGDSELAAMIAPRGLTIEALAYPEVDLPGQGGGPAKLRRPATPAIAAEFARVRPQIVGASPRSKLVSGEPAMAAVPFGSPEALSHLLSHLGAPALVAAGDSAIAKDTVAKDVIKNETVKANVETAGLEKAALAAVEVRQQRQLRELDRHNQAVLAESAYTRQAFFAKLDTSSSDKYAKSVEWYRDYFRNEVVGAFDQKLLPAEPRSRLAYDNAKWTGYEVVLDVFPDVFAYGVLLVPKDLKPGEKRPVVVCQHGLEGRPTDVFLNDHPAYHDFAAKLCERGFITFAPQNLYIFKDRFRTLQRKANTLKKTLFSVIVPQHQQIVNWLKTLPNVDPERIGFYGLSYGGKSAMRIPALVTDYKLSICSADFNEWVAKNASTRLPFSYVWTGEYEIFEFDLGGTFNYAEMAALICPRPFMVERGHTDGVSTDEWVAFEYAKVFNLYSHRMKIPARCEMEVFDGPHTINGQGTYRFLHKHLDWNPPAAAAK